MLSDKYTTVNIRDYFQNEGGEIGEEALVKVLSNFSCPLNQNVEKFLKEQAIEFTKKNQSVTWRVEYKRRIAADVCGLGIRKLDASGFLF